jgi:hypothetical protein
MSTAAGRLASSRPASAATGVVVAGGLGVAATWSLAHGGVAAPLLLLIGVILAATAMRWRWGVYLLVLYVTVEGAVTNLLYPSPYPLLFKDAVVLCIYAGVAIAMLRRDVDGILPRSVVRPLVFFGAVCVVESFNPATGGFGVALVGMRVLLLYIPLFFVGIALANQERTLDRVVTWVLLLSVPVTVFGIVEYFAGPAAVAAFGPGFAQGMFVVGPEATADTIFRPQSTFAFTGHFGDFLFFISVLAFGALHAPMSWGRRAVIAGVLCLTLVAVVLQSQRTSWVLLPLAFVLIYALNRGARGMVRAAPAVLGGVLLAVSVGGAVLADRLPVLTSGFAPYGARLSSVGGPFLTTLLSPVAITGTGTGTALGAQRWVTGGDVPLSFESGWAIPLTMLGIWGVIALGWLYFAVFRLMWRSIHSEDRDRRWLPSAVFVFCLLTAAVSGSVNYPPKNIYFWLFAGLVSARVVRRGVGAERS